MRGPSASRMPAACRPSPRRASIWHACCAIGPPTSARDPASSRPAAEAGGRTVAVHPRAVPNLLSLFRVGLVPVLVVTLTRSGREARAVAGLLFLIACITDFLDGWLARRRASTTALGPFLDPLAGKLIVAAVLTLL